MARSIDLKARVAKLFQHGFFGNILRIFVGTVLGQASGVLAAPILTRLYTPAEFGTLAVFSAIIFSFSSVAALRYEMAFTLVDGTKDLLNLAAVCGGALLVTTTIVAIATYISPLALFHALSLTAIYPYRFLLPMGFAAIGSYQVFSFLATRMGDFKTIARTRLLQTLGPVSQILMGLAHFGGLGLALGFVFAQSAGTSLLATRTIINRRTKWDEVSFAGCKAVAARFVKFPLISSWSALVNALGTSQLLLVFLSTFYSGDAAGFVFLTERVIARPLVIVSTSIVQVYLGEAGRNVRADPAKLRKRFLQLSFVQLGIVVSWIGGMNILVTYLFVPVFGAKWSDAVPFIRLMSIAYIPLFVMQPLINTLLILERQGLSAAWDFGRLFAVIVVFCIGWRTGETTLSVVFSYVICQAIAHLILYGLIYHAISKVQPRANHVSTETSERVNLL